MKAVQEQMEQLKFFPNYHDCYTVPLIKLVKKLAEIAPGDLSVSYFVDDGSEACESAIKMAKQLGAVITKSEIADEFRRPGKDFRHGFTFAGNKIKGGHLYKRLLLEKWDDSSQ